MNLSYLFFSFDGRISRQPYWLAFCVLVPATLGAAMMAASVGGVRAVALVELAFLYPELAVIVKRANDREMPSWIVLCYFVLSVLVSGLGLFGVGLEDAAGEPNTLYWIVLLPLLAVGLFILVELGFRPGVSGPNQYGPDPLQGKT